MYCGLKTCSDCARRSRNRDTVKAHEVTISVSIAQAVDPPKSVPQFRETCREGQLKRIYDNPSPEHHFHIEYRLLPGCGSGVHWTDVVTYGVVSKVFTEKDSRVVRCWEQDGLTYYGWRHKHTFKATKEALLDLYQHSVEVRVWNSRDKLSARARYDQPRAVRLPATAARKGRGSGAESGDERGASARPASFLIVNHSEVRPSGGKRRRRLAKRSSVAALSEGSGESDDPGAAITEEPSVPTLPGSPRQASALIVPAIVEEREEREEGEGQEGEAGGSAVVQSGTEDGGSAGAVVAVGDRSGTASLPHPSHPAALSLLPFTSSGTSPIRGLTRQQLKRLESEAAERAREEREGVAVLTLRMADLFANSTSISTKLSEPAQNLKGLEVGVALESQLMTESLRRELNPATITVNVARGLPSTPVSHEELRKRCDPVFVKYQFLQQPKHRTSGRPQAADVHWAESRVVLLGTLDRELLGEWLRGPPLVVEVHDRDRRVEPLLDPAVFGTESRDELLGTHAFGTGLSRCPEATIRPWDPYGVARADLSELLLGQRVLEVTTPITCGPSGPPPGEESVGVGPMGRVLPPALPPGDYLHSQSELTMTVELTYPFTAMPRPPTAPPLLVLPPSPQPSSASRQKTTPSRAKTHTPRTPSKMLGRKASAATSPTPPHFGSDAVNKSKSQKEVIPPRSPSHAALPSPREPPSQKSPSLQPPSLRPQPSTLPSSQKPYRSKTGRVEESPQPSRCPFGRLVYVVSATEEGLSLVQSILSLVNAINQEALGLQDLAKDVVLATLSTYKLTGDQLSSGACDVVTGFHVEDWERHVLVLEGLAEGGVGRVWAEQPHHHTQAESLQQVFFNSEYTFSERLYGSFDVDLPRIHLYQPFSELVRQSAIFVRDSVPQPCLRALLCLSELSGGLVVGGMRGVIRNELLPTAKEVMSLGLQFAVPTGFEVENGERSPSSEDHTPSRPRTPLLEQRDCRREPWEPLELQNPEYLQHLRQRSRAPPKDFITRNILHTQALAEQSSQRRRGRRRARSLSESALAQRRKEEALLDTPVHNYSIHTLNSTELAKARLRRELSHDPAHRYTYCQHYHSMTVVPIDVEAEKRAERLEAMRRWRTKEGFVYPGTLTARESNTHPQRPDPARIEDLSEPFTDGLLHTNTQKPSVERLRFGWEQRSQDFERYQPPPTHLGPPPPPSIHLGGASRSRELQECLDKEQEEWSAKVVVKDARFHALRRGIRTELSTSGPRASSQLDKLTGLLKDPPQKHSLRQEGLRLGSVPALDVVHNPSVDPRLDILVVERGEKGDEGGAGSGRDRGYQPGPFQGRSLKLNGNVIPIRKQGSDSFKQLHSEEFRLYYHTPSFLHKRPIQPLAANDNSLPNEENPSPLHHQTKEDEPQSTKEAKKRAESTTRESRHLDRSLDSCRPARKRVSWGATLGPALVLEQT